MGDGPVGASRQRRAWRVAWYPDVMRSTIDRAGRVVIPASIRERAGLTPGSELEITEDELGIRLQRVAPGPKLVRVGRRLVARPTRRPSRSPGRRHRGRSSKTSATAGRERLPRHQRAAGRAGRLRPAERPAQSLLHAVAEKRDRRDPRPRGTAVSSSFRSRRACRPNIASRAGRRRRRCCRRKSLRGWPSHDLPAGDRLPMLRAAARDDDRRRPHLRRAHRRSRALGRAPPVVVTDNRRHFLTALRYGMRVETPTEFLAGLKKKPR